MIAPAYTSTWMAPMNWASSSTNSAARQNRTLTSHSAAATGLLRVTNTTAETTATRPKK